MDAVELAVRVATHIRQAVRPSLASADAGIAAGVAASGDTTFRIDLIAEAALREALNMLPVPVACYSEDEGISVRGNDPELLLVVDPIDGTRPATAGLEACAVSVAVAKAGKAPVFGDVFAGAVYELGRDKLYTATKGGGAFQHINGSCSRLSPNPPEDLSELRWTLETVARPALANFGAASFLIDHTSLRGALFALNSSAFALCQVAAGSFGASLDLSARLLRDLFPDGAALRSVGGGRVMGLWAYDIAAAALVASEAGCAVSDAWGNSLNTMPLTRTDPQDMTSCICAASSAHHGAIMEMIDRGFERCRALSLHQV